jgi:hypothetical protein
MRTWAKGSAPAALLAVGVMALGNGTALADTSGNGSAGGGNQVRLPISLPIDISGNAVGAAGHASAQSRGGADVDNGGSGSGTPGHTSGDNSLLGGNQVDAPISIPVNACGNAVALFGSSEAGCKGGSRVRSSGRGGAGGNVTSGDNSALGGNQLTAPISAPLNACGNALAIFGDATAGCKGGAHVSGTGGGNGAGGNVTSGQSGVVSGNQIVAPITAPINVCGNAAAVLGEAFAGCKGGASVNNGGRGAGGNVTSGRSGVLAGNQVVAPITAPINVCGNATAVLGDAAAGCLGGAKSGHHGHHGRYGGGYGGGYGGSMGAWKKAVAAPQAGGLLPMLPNLPAVSSLSDAGSLTQQMRGSAQPGVPVLDDVKSALGLPELPAGLPQGVPDLPGVLHIAPAGLPELPDLPGLPSAPVKPSLPGKQSLPGKASLPGKPGKPSLPGKPALPGKPVAPRKPASPHTVVSQHKLAASDQHTGASGPLAPVTGLVRSTPAGSAVEGAAAALPVGELGLMSAEEPTGVTGMNSASLLALVVGAMFAASATIFATTRRLRPRRG